MDWFFVCKVIKNSKTVHYTSLQYVICFVHIIIVLMHVCMSKLLHFLQGLSFIHNQWVYRHRVSIYLGETGWKMETISFGKNAQENRECSLKCAHSFVVLSFVVVAAFLIYPHYRGLLHAQQRTNLIVHHYVICLILLIYMYFTKYYRPKVYTDTFTKFKEVIFASLCDVAVHIVTDFIWFIMAICLKSGSAVWVISSICFGNVLRHYIM